MRVQSSSGIGRDALVGQDKRVATFRLILASAAAAALAAFSSNALLLMCGIAIVPIAFALLWRPGETQVLFFAVLFQWLQVVVPVVNASRFGETIGQSTGIPETELAAWLGLTTIVVLALGMHFGVGRRALTDAAALDAVVSNLRPTRLLMAYGATFVVAWLAAQVVERVPGLRQPLGVLEILRWVVVFLLGWAALRDSRFEVAALGVVVFELVLGFTGFFSSFKTILFLGIVLALSANVHLGRTIRLRLVLLALLALVLSSFWQAVKVEYRTFLNLGSGAQIVAQPIKDRLEYLIARVGEVGINDLADGLESGFERLGYLEYFAQVIRHVPSEKPFQGGRLWGEALQHIVAPRALFPDKPVIDDSMRTSEFTGIRVPGASEGTSISIGYASESYVDFGPIWMFVPIFLLGYLWGWAYRWLTLRTRHRLLGLAAATTLVLGGALLFESSNIKLIGGMVTTILVFWVILQYAGDAIWRALAPASRRL